VSILTEISQAINAILEASNLDAIAKKCGLIKRTREITGKNFLLSMVLNTIESEIGTLSEIAYELCNQGIKVSKQAVHKKCNETAVKFLQKVLSSIIGQLRKEIGTINIERFPFIQTVSVFDSSEVILNKKLKNEFKHTRKQSAAFKLQAQIDILNNKIENLEICNATEPDQGYRRHLTSISSGQLLIGDLGYFRIESFATISSKDGYFLSRLFKRANVYNIQTGNRIDLNKLLGNESNNVVELQVCLGEAKLACRLVAIRLDGKGYAKRLAKIELAWKKDHRMKRKLEIVDGWTIFITNLPNNVDANSLFHLYKLRWQIELFFKMMKNFCNLRIITHTNKLRMQLSAYASLIAMGLLSMVSTCLKNVELSIYNTGKFFMKNFRRFLKKVDTNPKDAVLWISNILYKYAKKESRVHRPSTLIKLKNIQHVNP
jgi:hypothetical protein